MLALPENTLPVSAPLTSCPATGNPSWNIPAVQLSPPLTGAGLLDYYLKGSQTEKSTFILALLNNNNNNNLFLQVTGFPKSDPILIHLEISNVEIEFRKQAKYRIKNRM